MRFARARRASASRRCEQRTTCGSASRHTRLEGLLAASSGDSTARRRRAGAPRPLEQGDGLCNEDRFVSSYQIHGAVGQSRQGLGCGSCTSRRTCAQQMFHDDPPAVSRGRNVAGSIDLQQLLDGRRGPHKRGDGPMGWRTTSSAASAGTNERTSPGTAPRAGRAQKEKTAVSPDETAGAQRAPKPVLRARGPARFRRVAPTRPALQTAPSVQVQGREYRRGSAETANRGRGRGPKRDARRGQAAQHGSWRSARAHRATGRT